MSGLTVNGIEWRVCAQLELAVIGDHRLIAKNDAVLEAGAAADVTLTTDDRAPHDGFLADRCVRPQNRLIDDGLFFDMALVGDDAVRRDAAAGFDDGSVIDEARRFDNRSLLDAGTRRHPGRPRGLVEGSREVASVHDVTMHL